MSYDDSSGSASSAAAVMVALAVVALAGLGWYFLMPPDDEPLDVAPAVELPADDADPAGPRFPLPLSMPERSRPDDLTPLPPLDDSDRYFELEVSSVLGPGVAELLVDQALIEKIVATVDNLPRKSVAERIRPVGGLAEPFAADGQDGSGEYIMNPANFDRYDLLVTMLARADRGELTDLYLRFYPLFQQAYTNLGYPDAYFNDRIVQVIDHLLATPDVEDPVKLVRPHVLYEYADPDLEALSAGQKLMIRIGSEHRVVVKQFLEEIRERIAAAGESPPR